MEKVSCEMRSLFLEYTFGKKDSLVWWNATCILCQWLYYYQHSHFHISTFISSFPIQFSSHFYTLSQFDKTLSLLRFYDFIKNKMLSLILTKFSPSSKDEQIIVRRVFSHIHSDTRSDVTALPPPSSFFASLPYALSTFWVSFYR